jgi:GT2 family glycosyltransferase
MVGNNDQQKVMSVFLGVTPRHFDINFLPSTRSMAFRKSAWEEIGGFPESRENSAEDTDFNYNAVKLGLKYARVKSAVVEWGMPESMKDFFQKIKAYAKWDLRHGIWWHPVQGLASHNIRVLLVFLRYLLGSALLILSFWYPLLPYLIISFIVYLAWSYRKVFLEFGDWRIALWGPVLQITTDFAVMGGFISGIIG